MMNRGLEIALEHNNVECASYAYFHKALLYAFSKGASEEAARLFGEGFDYTSKVGFPVVNFWINSELVFEVLVKLGDWKKANEIASKMYEIATKTPSPSLLKLIATNTLGQLLALEGDLNRAEEYLKMVTSSTNGFGALQLSIPPFTAPARVYFAKKNFDDAKRYFERAYELAQKRKAAIGFGIYTVELLSEMTRFYIALGDLEVQDHFLTN
jgi:tetratricopeptide (TPR) repeat protein